MFMDDELSELKDRISQMSDDQLLRIVEVEYADYRKEAIEFVEAELAKRSMPFQKRSHEQIDSDEDEETDSVISATINAPCENCGGAMRSGSLFADKELTL